MAKTGQNRLDMRWKATQAQARGRPGAAGRAGGRRPSGSGGQRWPLPCPYARNCLVFKLQAADLVARSRLNSRVGRQEG